MAYTPIDPEAIRDALNNQGTQATSQNQVTQIALAQNGTSVANVIMNDMGTLATAVGQTTTNSLLSAIYVQAGTSSASGSVTGITYSDTPMFDAFGRLRTSNPQTLFDSKLTLDNAPQFWDDAQTSGSGTSSTYNRLRASVTMSVSNLTAGVRARQSKRWHDYQPGKSQLIFATFVMGAAATGITRRVGYYSTNNGIFLEQTSSAVSFVVRTWISGTPSDANRVAQTAWNIDKMDGTGPSGLTLDLTKSQILFIDFEWLGVGRVKCGFVINGLYVPCHQFLNANATVGVYMSSPNQPIRYSITNDGTGAAATFEVICSSVISEGGRSDLGTERGVSRGGISVTTSNSLLLHPLVTMRLNGSYLGANVNLLSATVACTTNSPFNWYWVENPTFAGGSPAYISIPNSAVEVDYQSGGTLSLVASTGTIIKSGAAAAVSDATMSALTEKALGSFINGTSDVWVLAVQRLSGTTETYYGAVNWRETGA